MARPKTVASILRAASLIENDVDRLNFMRANDNPAVRAVIQGAYHPNVIWSLPTGLVAYSKTGTNDENEGKLYQELKRLRYMTKGDVEGDKLPETKKFKMFVQLLESLAPDEAEMMVYVKDKILPFPHLTYEFCRQCFPDILPENGEVTRVEPVATFAASSTVSTIFEPPHFSTVTIQPKPEVVQENTNPYANPKPTAIGATFMWITDGEKNKKIAKNDPIPEGWRKGRAVKWDPFKNEEKKKD